MKKNLLYALTAVAMLTGCAKSDVVDSEINKESNQIGFSTYKNISRGNPVDDNTEFLKNGYAFGVTAFISTSRIVKVNERHYKIVEATEISGDDLRAYSLHV